MLDLSQKLYIEKVLKRFGMKNSKRGLLPLRYGIYLSKMMCPTTSEEIQSMSRILYASAIESLMNTMLCTRPDIALAVSVTVGINRIQAKSIGYYEEYPYVLKKD